MVERLRKYRTPACLRLVKDTPVRRMSFRKCKGVPASGSGISQYGKFMAVLSHGPQWSTPLG